MNGLPVKTGPKSVKKKVENDEPLPRFCTRIGCSGRIKYTHNATSIANIFRTPQRSPPKKPDSRMPKPLQTRSVRSSTSSLSEENNRSGKTVVVSASGRSNSDAKKMKMKKMNPESETSSSSSKAAVASTARNSNGEASSSRTRPPSSSFDRARNVGEYHRINRRADPTAATAIARRATTLRPEGFSRQYDISGAAEILLALERIEQEEELTHEQVVALEMSLILTGLTRYDQYRDMRLDIDDMSYEELLALGERMGTVSTPLSEDEISKCLKRRIQRGNSSAQRNEDDLNAKCSICQEEYVEEDAIGILSDCGHGYHEACIKQWLRLKNWCPICKASAKQL